LYIYSKLKITYYPIYWTL